MGCKYDVDRYSSWSLSVRAGDRKVLEGGNRLLRRQGDGIDGVELFSD